MKVHQLRQLLDALPAGFGNATVCFRDGDTFHDVNIVVVDPREVSAGAGLLVELLSHLDSFAPANGAMVQGHLGSPE